MSELTPQLLRDRVQVLLAALLGQYTWDGGAQTPAIRIEPPPFEIVPTCTGLECVIQASPSLEPSRAAGGGLHLQRTWRVVLKQWNPAQTTQAAAEALAREWPDCTIVLVARSGLMLEQCAVEIPEYLFEAAV